MTNLPELIIFDFDGTLYNFKGLPLKLCLSLLKDTLKIRADKKVKKELKGKDFLSSQKYEQEYSHLMANLTNLKEDDVMSWFNNSYMMAMQNTLKKHFTIRQDLETFFLHLKSKNIKIVIFSDYPMVQKKANAIGFTNKMWDCVSGAYCSQDFGAQKPCPRPFLEIAKSFNIESSKILVVGDRDDTDGEGARQSKMNFIQIKTHKTKIIDKNHQVLSWKEFTSLF